MKDNVCLFTLGENKGAVWEVTHKCDFGCQHCCNNSSPATKDECNTNEVKNGLRNLINSGVNSLYLSGGDPLSRPDFIEILKTTKELLRNKNLFFATNGKSVTDDIAYKISQIGVGSALVSLDGHTPEIARVIRPVQGSFNIAINAIRTLKKYNVPVTMGTVLWEGSYNHLKDFVNIALENRVDTLFFSWLMPAGRASLHKEIFADDSKYLAIGEQLKNLQSKYADRLRIRFRRFESIDSDGYTCPGGTQNFHIIPDGRVSVCSWVYKSDEAVISKSSIKNKLLNEIISEEPIKSFRRMLEERQKRGFGPGCPAICLMRNQTYFSNDPNYQNGKE